MPEPRIVLSLLNSTGCLAAIEDDDDNRATIVEHNSKRDPVAICTAAAKRLRKMADKFERLAKEETPFKVVTQDAINKSSK